MLQLQLSLCQHGRDDKRKKWRFCRHDEDNNLTWMVRNYIFFVEWHENWHELSWHVLWITVFYNKLYSRVKELLWEAATGYKPDLKMTVDNKDWQASHWVNLDRKILIKKTWESQVAVVTTGRECGATNHTLEYVQLAHLSQMLGSALTSSEGSMQTLTDTGRLQFLHQVFQSNPRGHGKYEKALKRQYKQFLSCCSIPTLCRMLAIEISRLNMQTCQFAPSEGKVRFLNADLNGGMLSQVQVRWTPTIQKGCFERSV